MNEILEPTAANGAAIQTAPLYATEDDKSYVAVVANLLLHLDQTEGSSDPVHCYNEAAGYFANDGAQHFSKMQEAIRFCRSALDEIEAQVIEAATHDATETADILTAWQAVGVMPDHHR